MWCIGQLTPQYRQRMYAVLDLYQRPYNCAEPVVCVDEKSKQLLSTKAEINGEPSTRLFPLLHHRSAKTRQQRLFATPYLAAKHPDLPVKPGHPCKVDYEYERKGTRNLFVAVEPLAGWRQIQVTRHRKKADFVHFIRQLLQGRYRHAKKVHLVVDNLNTHFASVFVEVLGQKRAQKLLNRVEFHYTPKHGSWLNMAEIEIGILDKQCLNGRIATPDRINGSGQSLEDPHKSTTADD